MCEQGLESMCFQTWEVFGRGQNCEVEAGSGESDVRHSLLMMWLRISVSAVILKYSS